MGSLRRKIGGLCYWRTALLPSPDDKPQRIVLDEGWVLDGGRVASCCGTPQRSYWVRL